MKYNLFIPKIRKLLEELNKISTEQEDKMYCEFAQDNSLGIPLFKILPLRYEAEQLDALLIKSEQEKLTKAEQRQLETLEASFCSKSESLHTIVGQLKEIIAKKPDQTILAEDWQNIMKRLKAVDAVTACQLFNFLKRFDQTSAAYIFKNLHKAPSATKAVRYLTEIYNVASLINSKFDSVFPRVLKPVRSARRVKGEQLICAAEAAAEGRRRMNLPAAVAGVEEPASVAPISEEGFENRLYEIFTELDRTIRLVEKRLDMKYYLVGSETQISSWSVVQEDIEYILRVLTKLINCLSLEKNNYFYDSCLCNLSQRFFCIIENLTKLGLTKGTLDTERGIFSGIMAMYAIDLRGSFYLTQEQAHEIAFRFNAMKEPAFSQVLGENKLLLGVLLLTLCSNVSSLGPLIAYPRPENFLEPLKDFLFSSWPSLVDYFISLRAYDDSIGSLNTAASIITQIAVLLLIYNQYKLGQRATTLEHPWDLAWLKARQDIRANAVEELTTLSSDGVGRLPAILAAQKVEQIVDLHQGIKNQWEKISLLCADIAKKSREARYRIDYTEKQSSAETAFHTAEEIYFRLVPQKPAAAVATDDEVIIDLYADVSGNNKKYGWWKLTQLKEGATMKQAYEEQPRLIQINSALQEMFKGLEEEYNKIKIEINRSAATRSSLFHATERTGLLDMRVSIPVPEEVSGDESEGHLSRQRSASLSSGS